MNPKNTAQPIVPIPFNAVTARFSRGITPKEVVVISRAKSGTYRILRTDTGEIREVEPISKA